MMLKLAAAMGAGLMLAGCAASYAPAPVATNFPISRQEKLQAAGHWAAVAGTIERQLHAALAGSPPRPLYLGEQSQATPFQRALTAALVTALVNDGHVVSKSPAGALKLDLDMQTVTFSANRPQYRYRSEAGAPASAGATALAAPAPGGIAAPPVTTTADGGFRDSYNLFTGLSAPGGTPRTEVILTASVTDQFRYVARITSAYYVADSDRALYGIVDPVPEILRPEETKLTRMFKVRGDM